jgi:hypothetical protein
MVSGRALPPRAALMSGWVAATGRVAATGWQRLVGGTRRQNDPPRASDCLPPLLPLHGRPRAEQRPVTPRRSALAWRCSSS